MKLAAWLPFDFVLSQSNPVYILWFYSWRIYFQVIYNKDVPVNFAATVCPQEKIEN